MEFLWRMFRKQRKPPASKLIALQFITDSEQLDQAIIIAADNGIPLDIPFLDVPGVITLIIRKKHKKYFKCLQFEIKKVFESWNLTPEDERGFKILYRERMEYYKWFKRLRLKVS